MCTLSNKEQYGPDRKCGGKREKEEPETLNNSTWLL